MSFKEDKAIGIVGGMGPHSGLTLFNHILSNTKAKTDQEHPSVIMMSFPKHIVDRTSFLEGDTEINPGYNIAQVILNLDKSGAKVVGIACNTAHSQIIFDVIVDELVKEQSKVKLINMPLETCLHLKSNGVGITRVGLMATKGTYKSGVYKEALENSGYEVIVPDVVFQNEVIHKMIYNDEFGIKAFPNNLNVNVQQLMNEALVYFKENNADVIILGCTELSMIFKEREFEGIHIVDPTEILALALLREINI
jgi:aspartate racemase